MDACLATRPPATRRRARRPGAACRGAIACAAALLALCLSACASAPTDARASGGNGLLRVMTFNVRLPVDADGEDRWEVRKGLAARTVRDAAPDVFGTQELWREQGDYLQAQLPGYAWFGRGRDADGSGERMGVFHRADTLRVLASGDFWLSDTPAVPGSITWGHPYPRMVTWARFERVADGRRFTLFNTHLPYRPEDTDARTRGARLLAARIAALPADEPVVVTGDFNDGPEGPAHAALLAAGLRDAFDAAPRRTGPAGTFHAFTGKPQRRIDWILVRGFDVRSVQTLDGAEDGRYPSDHFPLVAELAFPETRPAPP